MTYENLSAYAEDARALAQGHANKRFLNDSSAHAKIIAEVMLGASSADECLIYSGRLNKECYQQALNDFKGTRIRVIVEHDDAVAPIKHDYAELIASNKLLVRTLAKPHEQFDGVNHFFLSGNAYRYELDHDKARAILNFNEPDTVEKLRANFEKMWELSQDALQS